MVSAAQIVQIFSPPAWVMPEAPLYDLDFTNLQYYGGTVASNVASTQYRQSLLQSNDNGSGGGAIDAYGNVIIFASTVPRITRGYGLWVEANTTNIALWCRDFTNAVWVAVNMTTAKNQIGANGVANSASLLTSTLALGHILQTITLTSRLLITHCFVKAVTVTGAINLTEDGATYTDISGSINTSTFTRVKIPTQTLANPVVGFQFANSGDSIIVDYFQCESNSIPTGPLVTTSGTIVRGVEEPAFGDITGTHPNAGINLINTIFQTGAPYSGFVSYSGTPPVGNGWILAPDAVSPSVKSGADGTAPIFNSNGHSVTNGANATAGQGNLNKLTFRADGAKVSLCVNGGAIATTASTACFMPLASGSTHIGAGNNGAGNNGGPLGGYIKRFAFWNKDISDGLMINATASDSPWGN